MPDSADGPFEFWKVIYLTEVTRLRAASLSQLLTGITLASQWSIFFHLHQPFFRDPWRLPEYANDFAGWTQFVLGESVVAERLANLNLARSLELEQIRREISLILAEHLREVPGERQVPLPSAFVFCQPRLLAFANGPRVDTPEEFLETLRRVDSDSIAYHLFFAPQITPGPVKSDFSIWFRQRGLEDLALQLDAMDPFLRTLEENRAFLVHLIEEALAHEGRS